MADLEGRTGGDRQGRHEVRAGEPGGGKLGLALALLREGRIALALEAALGDPGRFAVAQEDDRRVEAGRDERGRAAVRAVGDGVGAQWSLPSRTVQRSMSDS